MLNKLLITIIQFPEHGETLEDVSSEHDDDFTLVIRSLVVEALTDSSVVSHHIENVNFSGCLNSLTW